MTFSKVKSTLKSSAEPTSHAILATIDNLIKP